MISWRQLFRRLDEENETARKKKQALDSLLASDRISQPTYDLFDKEIAEAISEIEKQQQGLLGKMNAKTIELEEQTRTLEILLANFELQHVTGEVDKETYDREISVLSVGIESTRRELDAIRDAACQISDASSIGRQETSEINPEVLPEPIVEFVKLQKSQGESEQKTQSGEEPKANEAENQTEQKQ